MRARGAGAALWVAGFCWLAAGAGCKRRAPEPPPPPPAAAVVNGTPIPLASLQRELDRVRQGSGKEFSAAPGATAPEAEAAAPDPLGQPDAGPAPEASVPALGRALLPSLIDRQLLLSRAAAHGLSVSEAEIERELEAITEGRNPAAPAADKGQTPDELRAEVHDRLLSQKAMAAEVGKLAPPSTLEIGAYYAAHRQEFERPEEVRAEQIVVASAEEAKRLLDEVRAGRSFEELARAHSGSPDARRGGDLGFFAKGTMPQAFDDACFALRVGQVSGVVASRYGYHLFKLLARRPARHLTQDEARPEIERRLLLEKRRAAEQAVLARLRSAAQVEIHDAELAKLR